MAEANGLAVLLPQITLVLGVDRVHLEEFRYTWPSWLRFKPEILQMPLVVFYDPGEIGSAELTFFDDHPDRRFVPWQLPAARTHREAMLTGWLHIPANFVTTPWYLKLDADTLATEAGPWIESEWFAPDDQGRLPVFISSRWGFSMPRYVMDLLDDWADKVPEMAIYPRLDLPYSSDEDRVYHPRVVSWIFFGSTDWTRKIVGMLPPEGRLPHPSQDTFLSFCAKRMASHFVRLDMTTFGWVHGDLERIKKHAAALDIAPEGAATPSELPPSISMHVGEPRLSSPTRSSDRGVIFYNYGAACLVRLLVALATLRRHYSGPVAILAEGEESIHYCRRIGEALDAECIPWNSGVPEGDHRVYLAKTRFYLGSPFKKTVSLDADVIVRGPIEPLFGVLDESEFGVAPLGEVTSDHPVIEARIRHWSAILPDDIEPALRYGPAINCGVLAFRREAKIFEDWFTLALPGRDTRIPDEVCCQIILHRYPHSLLESRWNRSCRFRNAADPDARIVHFHGRRHCQPGLTDHGSMWLREFEAVRKINLAAVKEWMPARDEMLEQHLVSERLQKRKARERAMRLD